MSTNLNSLNMLHHPTASTPQDVRAKKLARVPNVRTDAESLAAKQKTEDEGASPAPETPDLTRKSLLLIL